MLDLETTLIIVQDVYVLMLSLHADPLSNAESAVSKHVIL